MAVPLITEATKDWASTSGTGGRQGVWGLSGNAAVAVSYVGTIFIILVCPCAAIYLWYSLTVLDGSLWQFIEFTRTEGIQKLAEVWPKPSTEAWQVIAVFGFLEALLQYFVPGKRFLGPASPRGNIPVYKANGFQCYSITLGLFFAAWRAALIEPAQIYDLFGEILAALSLFSFLFCAFLYIKGRFSPCSSDNGCNKSFVYDYYWGRELYPRIGKNFDIKTWTNCRMGMMSWAILPLCYAAKQIQVNGYVSNSMLVSAGLIELYVAKFFWWETGYWKSMDIAHDRAGYYLCWGCLVWVPAVYTSPPMYLATRPHDWPTPVAIAIFMAGALSIYINYDSDRQRQVFRETDGKALVWGKKPEIIYAKYKTADQKEATSLLLASGWWGTSRHFHYLPEILSAVFWTLPAGFSAGLPWFYTIFLTLLLTDRSYRDDARCQSKYGKYWDEYCRKVRYRMIPYVF